MITIAQIKMARIGLGLTQGELARRVGLSVTGYQAIEAGTSDPKISHYRDIIAALEDAGARFDSGGVRIETRSDEFLVEPDHEPSAEVLEAAMAIVAAAKKSREPRGGLG